MKTKRLMSKRLQFEALEGRVVLSAALGCPSSAAQAAVSHHLSAPAVAESAAKATPIESVSSNWSGYAVSAAAKTVTNVAGSWVEPTVSSATNGYSSVWVGIDGYSSNSVEQLGTEADVAHGTVTYSAWYEMYPSGMVTIPNFTVKPGDAITASVKYDATHQDFVLSINDSTESESYSTTQSGRGQPGLRPNGSSKHHPPVSVFCLWRTLERWHSQTRRQRSVEPPAR